MPKAAVQKTSLNLILQNWIATVFAYQPNLYFELDQFRRKLHEGFVTPDELQNELLKSGLLRVSPDSDNPRRLYLTLDAHMFPEARGKLWSVTIKRSGDEIEFACADVPELESSEKPTLH